jgi:hypothetical protein
MGEAYHLSVPCAIQFTTNGYLVVAPASKQLVSEYQGIEGDQWPIESDDLRRFARGLGVPEALEGVQVATLWEETLAYWRRCMAQGIPARLLLVSTHYAVPQVVPPEGCWRPLGYDVAEPMGNHSVVRHELILGHAPQLSYWRSRLNGAGLFDELETVEEFLRARQAAVDRGDVQGMVLSPGFRFVPVMVHLFTSYTEPFF